MLDKIFRNPWISVFVATLLTLILFKIDPFGFGLLLTVWQSLLYCSPFLFFSVYVLTQPVFAAKSTTPQEKRAIIYEQIYSILRKVLTVFGALIALGVFEKIPVVGQLNNVLVYIAESWQISIGAIEVLIGLVLGIVGQFSNNTRFEVRALVNPRKIDLE